MRLLMYGLLAACSYDPATQTPDASELPDPIDGCASFSGQVNTCMLVPTGSLDIGGSVTFDTNNGDLFAGAVPVDVQTLALATPSGEVMAIVATTVNFRQGMRLRATGARPMAILAFDTIAFENDARIDVSLHGAGARVNCVNGAAKGQDQDGGAGGGGGAGFGGAGGGGGKGNDDNSMGGVGGQPISLPPGILGGCPGANGGDDNNDIGGRGGLGGGAVYLAAARRIDLAVDSGIHAGGGGGGGGEQSGLAFGDAGGGGGGTGGMIVLEAATVAGSGTLAANGGAGGQGSGSQAEGAPGASGRFDATPAAGGSGTGSSGSSGGVGGATTPAGSVSTRTTGAGGGGGGAAGFIRIIAPSGALTGVVSPPPS